MITLLMYLSHLREGWTFWSEKVMYMTVAVILDILLTLIIIFSLLGIYYQG